MLHPLPLASPLLKQCLLGSALLLGLSGCITVQDSVAQIARVGDDLVEVCESCHQQFKPDLPTMDMFGELSPLHSTPALQGNARIVATFAADSGAAVPVAAPTALSGFPALVLQDAVNRDSLRRIQMAMRMGQVTINQ